MSMTIHKFVQKNGNMNLLELGAVVFGSTGSDVTKSGI